MKDSDEKVEIVLKSRHFVKGNFNRDAHSFGHGLVIDGGFGEGFAWYELEIPKDGHYEFWTKYLSPGFRPVDIFLGDDCIKKWAMAGRTKSMNYEDIEWFKEDVFFIKRGKYELGIRCKGVIPHFEKIKFLKVNKEKFISEKDVSLDSWVNKTEQLKAASRERTLRERYAESLKIFGKKHTLKKIFRYFSLGNLKYKYARVMGVFDASLAFLGPQLAQIDVTYDCNNNCIGCWCHADLLEEKKMPPEVKKYMLPYEMVMELIDELYELGTREIYFAGGGEPFMHPRFMDIVEYVKNKGMVCFINTNFTLVSEEDIKRMIELGVDHLTVSIWAGTAETYVATHPNKTKEIFSQLKERLSLLNKHKYIAPHVKIYNVISNLNYFEIDKMIEFVVDTGSDAVEFTMIDTIPGKTDVLLLTQSQNAELLKQCKEMEERVKSTVLGGKFILFGFEQFIKRISHADTLIGEHDKGIIDKIPCYIGWLFTRINADGDVNSCLKSHRFPVGNIYQNKFKTIWNGRRQIEFREKTLKGKRNDPIFRLIGNDPDKEVGCYKSCDDIARNLHMKQKIEALNWIELGLIKLAAKIVGFLNRLERRYKFFLPVEHRKKVKKYITECSKKIAGGIIDSDNKESFILENLDIVGMLDSRKALVGPEHVVIDLTNKCDLKCIGCWTRSPFLKDKKPPLDWEKQELSLATMENLIDDLAKMGTKRIRFTGGGEPFIHPYIMQFIEKIKQKNMICAVTTNGNSLNKDNLKRIVDLGLDDLAVSLWAGSAGVYVENHPGRKEEDFYRIRDNLLLLKDFKKSKQGKPYLTLCNVISKLNFQDIGNMFQMAYDVNADAVYFTLVDVIEGATESLMLSDEQRKYVLKKMYDLRDSNEAKLEAEKLFLDNFDGFIRRLKNENAQERGEYDKNIIDEIPCHIGWLFVRIMANGEISPCCRGVNKTMGTLENSRLPDIWNSEKYCEFRSKAKYLPKSDFYFEPFGCYKTCDNLMHNEPVFEKIKRFSREEIDLLCGYAKFCGS